MNALRDFPAIYKLLNFLAWGLPALAIAILLNWFLVDFVNFPKPVAYALVLVVQVILNFFICRAFVFKPGAHKTIGRQFIEFFLGILAFRLADWALYSVLVQFLPAYYLAIQVINVFLFALLKFRFAKSVIEGP